MADSFAKRHHVLITIAAIVLVAIVTAVLYLRSDRFKERVKNVVIAQLERGIGGRVELGSFRWNLSKLEFEADDLVIHGLEPLGVAPLVVVDHAVVRIKIISLLGREVGLRYVRVDRPAIHLIVFPDGTTNLPSPKVKQESGRSPVELLFDLAIERLEIADGSLLLNQRSIPLDFRANDVGFELSYAMTERKYTASLNVGESRLAMKSGAQIASKAEARVVLWPTYAVLESLKWSSDKSSLQASGRMNDFREPKIELAYESSLNLLEAAALAGVTGVRNGTASLKGKASYAGAQQYSTQGQITISDTSYAANGVAVAGVNASSAYTISPERIALPSLVAQAFGGVITGGIEITNWTAAKDAESPQRGAATLALRGIDVERVLAMASSRELPLDKLNVASRGGGRVNVSWRGSPANLKAEFDLETQPPQDLSPQALPLTTAVRGSYTGASRVVRLDQFDLSTRATTVTGSGVVGARNSQLQLEMVSNDLGEFEPIIAAFGTAARIPADVKGSARFHGVIFGQLSAPTIQGQLQASNFDALVTMPTAQASANPATGPAKASPSTAEPTPIHIDSLQANIQYAPEGFSATDGVIRRGKTQIAFTGTVGLTKGKFGPESPIQAQLRLRDGDIRALQQIAGVDYPVSGTVNASARVGGTQHNLQAQGSIVAAKGEIYGEAYRELRADLRALGREVQLLNGTLTQNGATLSANGAFNLDSKQFRFKAQAEDVNLAKLRNLQARAANITGIAGFTVEGSGTLAAPVINGVARIGDVSVNGEPVGDITAQAVTRGGVLDLTATTSFREANVNLNSTVRLRGDFPAEGNLTISRIDIGPLLRSYLKQPNVRGELLVQGAVQFAGPLKRPRQLSVQGELAELSGSLENIRVANEGPIRFTLKNEVVTLEQFRLIGDGTNFTGAGTVNLVGARAVNIIGQGSVNLKLLQGFEQDLQSYGTANIDLAVGGSLNRPQAKGTIAIADAGVSFIDLPNGLSNINGTLQFTEDRIQVQKLTAQTGGGQLNLGGSIYYGRALSFDLTAMGEDIRLRYPPGVSAMANADLRLTGNLRNSLLSGEITVTKFSLNTRFDFALYVARRNKPVTVPDPNSPLQNMKLDVHVVTTPELQVETSLAKLSGDADLRIRGTAANPTVLGRANITEGQVSFNGTEYNLERGEITFTNPTRIEPTVNLEATARVRDYDITLSFHGPMDKLRTTYRSEPPLPTSDIIALLAVGRTREDAVLNQGTQTSFTETAQNAILSQALNAAVSSRVQKLFGVSRIKIDPQVGGPENNPNARLTIEQQVANDVTLTYITNLSQSQQQVIQVEYNINRNVSLIIVRDQNGVLGFDVRVRQRIK